jgi:hypothetical protein
MQLALVRSSIAVLLTASFAIAQQPASVSQDAPIQALLKEVRALRIAMEQSNQIGPRIQIVLARIQIQEERVRNATRQLQDARDKVADVQTRKAALADRVRQFETQIIDPNKSAWRKQMEFELNETKAEIERANALEQQYRAREAEANSLLLTEQGRWNEANDQLTSIERALVPRLP